MIGRSRAMLELFDTVKRLARHQSTILILGESGTGKELIARALHTLGPRRDGPFVAVNCATLSEPLLESELFGHERGAFTGADRSKEGVMETADGGTLFLDEVNEMGLGCQAKLLRALERREFRRVGGTRKIAVNIHLLAASNADLEALVESQTLPLRPLLPPQGRDAHRPAAAGSQGRDPGPRAALPRGRGTAVRSRSQAPDTGRSRPARALPLAGQHPRAAQLHGEPDPHQHPLRDRRGRPASRTCAK